MKAAIRFTDMALQHCIGDDLLPVCTLLQERLDELRLRSLPRKPCESACIVFKTPLSAVLMDDVIGVVANSLTAAHHCRVEGSGRDRAMPGKMTLIAVTTYNRELERVNVGGDKLTAKWITRESCDSDTLISLPITSLEDVPKLCVTDEKNGQYIIKYTLHETGTYMLSIHINNEPLPDSPFHIDCSHWCFDANSCTENILLLSNRREAVKVRGFRVQVHAPILALRSILVSACRYPRGFQIALSIIYYPDVNVRASGVMGFLIVFYFQNEVCHVTNVVLKYQVRVH